MKYIVANTVYEESSDTSVAIYKVTEEQLKELLDNMDEDTGFVDEGEVSFDFGDLDYVDPNSPFTGTIECILTFYYSDL